MIRRDLCDADLHAFLLGRQVGDILEWLEKAIAAALPDAVGNDSLCFLQAARNDPASPDWQETLCKLYQRCPTNVAERLHEAVNIMRIMGQRALPPLLPLAHRMLQAELHLYVNLEEGKPYRDHLAHMTRVASLALLLTHPGDRRIPERLVPKPLRWTELRETWSMTPEFNLLRAYAAHKNLGCPDPARSDDPWRVPVQAALLLAGMTHDMGYIHKSLGQVAEQVARTFRELVFPPGATLDPALDHTPMAGLYRMAVHEAEHGQRHAVLGTFLERFHREIHSMVGALWLATLEHRLVNSLLGCDGIPLDLDDVSFRTPSASRVPVELVFQLASMLAFAHDLAMSDEARRKLLGLRSVKIHRDSNPRDADVINAEHFPVCTLFALADVLQEFGRLLRTVDGDQVRFVVPIAGIRLADESELGCVNDGLDRWWSTSKPPKSEAVYVSFLTRTGKPNHRLLTEQARKIRCLGGWRESLVGNKVPEWLVRAGLSDSITLDGDPRSYPAIKRVAKEWKEMASAKAEPRSRKQAIQNQLTALQAHCAAVTGIRVAAPVPKSFKVFVKQLLDTDANLPEGDRLLPLVGPVSFLDNNDRPPELQEDTLV